MQDKIQEIMGLVDGYASSAIFNRDADMRRISEKIKSKLRELVREPLSDDAVLDAFCNEPHQNQFVSVFKQGVRYAERAHNITNTSGEV